MLDTHFIWACRCTDNRFQWEEGGSARNKPITTLWPSTQKFWPAKPASCQAAQQSRSQLPTCQDWTFGSYFLSILQAHVDSRKSTQKRPPRQRKLFGRLHDRKCDNLPLVRDAQQVTQPIKSKHWLRIFLGRYWNSLCMCVRMMGTSYPSPPKH